MPATVPYDLATHLLSQESYEMAKAKSRTVFVCDACGNDSPKWEGRCSTCGEWNSMARLRQPPEAQQAGPWIGDASTAPVRLSEVSISETPRLITRSDEFDRVLGGGIVPGSLILIAGDPGIGKSTLLLKIASDVSSPDRPVVYVTGEESPAQVKIRADRLGLSGEDLFILQATDTADVLGRMESLSPGLVIVDSIQTLHDTSVSSEPGSVAQIRECTRRMLEWSKATDVPVILAGHVTKGGDIAGPRVMEHMVDVVLYMEGDPVSSWRLLRSVKNRFGPTNEVGVFEMTGRGLIEVSDPSSALLSQRGRSAVGSVVVPIMEGTRPMLVEVQALTNPTSLPAPRRVSTGIDNGRMLMICAVLSRRVGLPLSNQDVIVNVAGGMRIAEPAGDLGVAVAIASSVSNTPVAQDIAVAGEIGLSGEVRRVPHLERRASEVTRLGLERFISPSEIETSDVKSSVDTVLVKTIGEALSLCLPIQERPDPAFSLSGNPAEMNK